jgi:hypothetical protein
MIKKYSFVLCALLFTTLFLLACTGESPFKPENATVNLSMENSDGYRDSATITDTVENHVRINLIGYLPSYIDSVKVVIETSTATDTNFTFPKSTSWADSQRIDIMFLSEGTRTVTVTVFVEGKEKHMTATIVVVGNTSVPTTSSPANSATGVAVNPTLTWNAITGAVTYHVQVSTASDFSAGIVVDDSTLTAGSMALGALTNGTKYYWRVNAKNAGGTSAWALANFTTIVKFALSISATNGTVTPNPAGSPYDSGTRSEEHTSELQSLS